MSDTALPSLTDAQLTMVALAVALDMLDCSDTKLSKELRRRVREQG